MNTTTQKTPWQVYAMGPELLETLSRLRLEALHYRNTGVGKQFLDEALRSAEDVIFKTQGIVQIDGIGMCKVTYAKAEQVPS